MQHCASVSDCMPPALLAARLRLTLTVLPHHSQEYADQGQHGGEPAARQQRLTASTGINFPGIPRRSPTRANPNGHDGGDHRGAVFVPALHNTGFALHSLHRRRSESGHGQPQRIRRARPLRRLVQEGTVVAARAISDRDARHGPGLNQRKKLSRWSMIRTMALAGICV
jgi:hypothetical protein